MAYLFLLLGILIGSFLNVCIYRIPKDESVVTGRSHCMGCNKNIPWYDLVPILSYVILGGKCRFCKKKLSIQYPIVELLNGVAYLWIFMKFDYSVESIIYCLFVSALITLSFIDWKFMIIPNKINVFILILAIIHLIYNIEQWKNYIIGFFIVSGLLLLIAIITKGQIGGGDIKLMAASGLLLGWDIIILALCIGSVVGSIISIILLITKKGGKMVPFGPYLSIGMFISLVYGKQLIQWYLSMFF
ncbi:leader peptidase (prepilin peptidase)/N-methyltransferase [Natranaerovirga pectinivora]|uniref:Leader peptidase (Prepilin peptidase)/N-methyltransferase n=1 Tax=Natranaerovirga pectinivora TaxID=682400 RepID=A0A4R3MUD4_9FIRM|nr:A24 family peptidase [Natranaerovirga pectinivora]TCT16896.1 leader peptidase (prepilin peptidase)/N-methyltransferase [Natranaerovirga pectinivora]